MVVYAKPKQRKKEESERLRGERDQIKFFSYEGTSHLQLEYQATEA